jgi:hypothetical protein
MLPEHADRVLAIYQADLADLRRRETTARKGQSQDLGNYLIRTPGE